MSIFTQPSSRFSLQFSMIALVIVVGLILLWLAYLISPGWVWLPALVGLMALGYAYWLEPSWVQYKHVTIPVRNLPPAFDGWQFALLSDLHCGHNFRKNMWREVVQKVNASGSQAIFIAGDFFSVGKSTPESCGVDLVAGLRAPFGVYAVLGNHEAFPGTEPYVERLYHLPLRLLRDEVITLSIGGDHLSLMGMEDAFGPLSEAELAQRLDNLMPFANSDCRILLYHRPDAIKVAAARGIELMLSGHTHAGQVRVPGWGPVYCFSLYGARYDCGLFQEGPTALYVSRGIGMALLPFRFCCRPEVTYITLVPSNHS